MISMKFAKRVMSLTLVMGLMVSSLTGCTSSKDDTANKGDKTKVVFIQGNYYMRCFTNTQFKLSETFIYKIMQLYKQI